MALQLSKTTNSGINVADAYCRVVNPRIIGKTHINFNAAFYIDALMQTPFHEDVHLCDYDINGSNPHTQAYDYLKSLPDYSSAVDV